MKTSSLRRTSITLAIVGVLAAVWAGFRGAASRSGDESPPGVAPRTPPGRVGEGNRAAFRSASAKGGAAVGRSDSRGEPPDAAAVDGARRTEARGVAPPRAGGLKRSDRGAGFRDHLPPGMAIEQGEVSGQQATGPLVVSGRQALTLASSNWEAEGEHSGSILRIEESEQGHFVGSYRIEAARAEATADGVRFFGPLKLSMGDELGQYYTYASGSADSYVFVDRRGGRKVFFAPEAIQIAKEPDAPGGEE